MRSTAKDKQEEYGAFSPVLTESHLLFSHFILDHISRFLSPTYDNTGSSHLIFDHIRKLFAYIGQHIRRKKGLVIDILQGK